MEEIRNMDLFDLVGEAVPNSAFILWQYQMSPQKHYEKILQNLFRTNPSILLLEKNIKLFLNKELVEQEDKIEEILISRFNGKIFFLPREIIIALINKRYTFESKIRIGITASFGKTSMAALLHQKLLRYFPEDVLLISTMGIGITTLQQNMGTTPSFCNVKRNLHNYGASIAIIEYSSLALKQNRLKHLDFDSIIIGHVEYTHEEFHPTPEDYITSKAKIQDHCKNHCIILNSTYEKFQRYDLLSSSLDYFPYEMAADMVTENNRGVHLLLEKQFGIKETRIDDVTGRVTMIGSTKNGAGVYCDGAHSAAHIRALERYFNPQECLLILGVAHHKVQSIGNMQEVLQNWPNIILTDDNPGQEHISPIGLWPKNHSNCTIILDRFQAIARAIEIAKRDQKILILGKSTESYNHIIYDDREIFYDEIETVKIILHQHHHR